MAGKPGHHLLDRRQAIRSGTWRYTWPRRLTHLLDWFHITMRIGTVMRQVSSTGLSHHNPDEGRAADRLLRQIKGYLWNGNHHDGHRVIEEPVEELECIRD